MHKVPLKVLALLAALTLVWGTNWPMFAIALRGGGPYSVDRLIGREL